MGEPTELIPSPPTSAVKARLNFEGCSGRNSKIKEVSQHSESRTPNVRGEHRRGRRFGRSRSIPERTSVFSRIRRDRSESPRHRPEGKGRRDGEHSIGWEAKERVCQHTRKAVTRVPAQKERNPFPENVTIKECIHGGRKCSLRVKIVEGDTGNQERKNQSQALKRTTYPSHGDDSEDHLKIFQAAAKVERWAIPTWCHMFNSTLTGSSRVWFDDLPSESVDSYDDLKKAFLANFLQQKKCIKDPVEIHRIKQREGESTEDFIITNPELIKHLHDNIPKSVDEMMRVTTTFLKGEVAASNQVRKKTLPAWKQQEAGRRKFFERMGDFRNQQRSKRRRDKFTLLTKSQKKILALDKGKFKTLPPMTTPVEKRNNNKFFPRGSGTQH
ncbi:reverse transcriptase domain-containing protein [Tanacetum coccineum]